MMDMLMRNRKYKLAVFFAISTVLLTAFGKLDGLQYVASVTFILGLYNYANISGDKNES